MKEEKNVPVQGLLNYLKDSPTAYQAVEGIRMRLKDAGVSELSEKEAWSISPGKTYFVTRNDTSIIAFTVPKNAVGFRIYAAHSDCPLYKVKENPESEVEGKYIRLNTEPYGGMIPRTWFDRPLSVAGRLVVKSDREPRSVLINVDRDLLLIPSVAIHMTRDAADEKPNPQQDMLPLFSLYGGKGTFLSTIAESAGVKAEDVLSYDLYLYLREAPVVWGAENEFFSASGIDDRECAFGGLEGFLGGKRKRSISVFAVFDNEEVGSGSRQGAASTFLKDVLTRISCVLGDDEEMYQRRIADSFLLSADNGHAVHPNHPEKCDPTNRPVIGGGIVLKYSASMSYTTDGMSAAVVKLLAEEAGVPIQTFFNRSDMRGGSTLGRLSLVQAPIPSADIGLAQLAMHSAYETAGVKDYEYLVKLIKTYFA